MARDDVGWLTALVLPSSRSTVYRRLAQEGVEGTPERLLAVVERALAGQGPLSKMELGERLASLGVPAAGQGIVYLAFLAAAHGRAVFGPDRAGRPTYVHSGDWLGAAAAPSRLDRASAMTELAVRYLRAHGPSSPDDLAAWSGQGRRECRDAFATLGSRLEAVPNTPLWTLRSSRFAGRPGVVLVPGFDDYLLGWRERDVVLAKEHTKAVIPGGGIIRPAVVSDGLVIGTWELKPVRTKLFGAAPATEIEAEAADVERFLST
jgi:hypothetical protein